MCLERCMRFLPHKQDTGGFFVAVLQKKPASDVAEAEVAASSSAVPSAEKAEAEAEAENQGAEPMVGTSSSSSSHRGTGGLCGQPYVAPVLVGSASCILPEWRTT